MLLFSMFACGDLIDPDLESAEIEVEGEVVQTISITPADTNFFEEAVSPDAAIVLLYDEPLDLKTLEAHVWLEDQTGGRVDVDLDLKLTDVVVTPVVEMSEGNHMLVAEAGIDDASGNTTEATFNISFYVEDE